VFLEGSVLGHASEAKSALLLGKAKAPHFAYLGDSVLGHSVNLGAGTKLSNLPIASRGRSTVVLEIDGTAIDTRLRKFGAVLGDGVEVGCNAILNPGVVLGRRCVVYAGAVVQKGVYGPDQILKLRQVIERAQLESF
jgi:bifunctional N-acetylglucosamine-1-phosphate-uridyltransferase/glucosamine-1-phosphate-acetyltransferase GlmU-like protein